MEYNSPITHDYTAMVRYGRDRKTNNRNSVLYTIKCNDVIYFGVSRCCPWDHFNKQVGLNIAVGRCMKALDGSPVGVLTRETDFGAVPRESIVQLLEWFRSLNK